MTDQQRAAIVERSVQQARRNRRLRQQYGLGIIGWITLGVQVIQLVMKIVELIRDRERLAERFGSNRMQAYSMLREQGADAELTTIVEDAEYEVLGV